MSCSPPDGDLYPRPDPCSASRISAYQASAALVGPREGRRVRDVADGELNQDAARQPGSQKASLDLD